jgi:O-antigen ligase
MIEKKISGRGSGIVFILLSFVFIVYSLSLNGVMNYTSGNGQIITALTLPALLICLILSFSERGLSVLSATYVISLLLYIAFAFIFAGGIVINAQLPSTYLGTVLIVAAFAAAIPALSADQLRNFLRLVLIVTFLAVVLILGSPLLEWINPLAVNIDGRFAGLYQNASEAGVVCMALFVMALSIPVPRAYQILCIVVAVTGAVLTLSKAAVLGTALIGFVYAFTYLKGAVRLYALFGLLFATIGLLIMLGASYDHLTLAQQRRLDGFIGLLGGRVDASSTTGRSVVWGVALERISATLPWGSGIGSFHSIYGGRRDDAIFQGVHNVYLMILGESGIIPFVTFAVANIAAGVVAFLRRAHSFLPVGLLLLLQVDMALTHSAFAFRSDCLFLGLALGTLAVIGRQRAVSLR